MAFVACCMDQFGIDRFVRVDCARRASLESRVGHPWRIYIGRSDDSAGQEHPQGV